MNSLISNYVIFTDKIAVAYPPLESALSNWADATTDPTSDRWEDLLHDKRKVVSDFFEWIGKPIHEIAPYDVKSWQNEIEQRDLASATIYAMINQISLFLGLTQLKVGMLYLGNEPTAPYFRFGSFVNAAIRSEGRAPTRWLVTICMCSALGSA